MRYVLYVVILLAIGFCLISGCAVNPTSTGHPSTTGLSHVPASLTHVSTSLGILAVVGVIALAVGVGLYFTVPETHKLSIILAGIGGSLVGISLLLKVSLWLIPWIAYSFLGLAVIALGYEFYIKISGNKKLPDLTSISGTGL